MEPRLKVLLIHNRFRWYSIITWLSLLIRVFTCSKWNHTAIEYSDETGTFIIESVGKGVIVTRGLDWLHKSDRIVLPLSLAIDANPREIFERAKALEGKGYGFFDLVQILLHIIRTKWFASGNSWNGKDGVLGLEGWFCSELTSHAVSIPDAHLVVPGAFEYMPIFTKGPEYQTRRHP